MSGCFPNIGSRFNRCACGREEDEQDNWLKVITRGEFELLPEEEKDRVFRDLYGVDDGIEENEVFVKEKIHELLEEIERMTEEEKRNYKMAILQGDKTYVDSDKFRLMFLRAERFSAPLAAIRMCKHFDEKLSLFGVKKLGRRIMQSDLNDDDKEYLFSGYLYINNNMECFGRPVVFIRNQLAVYKSVENIKRGIFYYFQTVVENDEEAQKRGFVNVVYSVESTFISTIFGNNFSNILPDVQTLFYTLPTRVASIHHCTSNMVEYILSLKIWFLLPPFWKSRHKYHFGLHTHCRKQMVAYGLQLQHFPVRPSGEYMYELLRANLEKHREREEAISTSGIL